MATHSDTFTLTNGRMRLAEDMPWFGRLFFLFLAFMALSLLIRIQSAGDASAMVKMGGWVVLGPMAVWFALLTVWRRQVTLDFVARTVSVRSGPVLFFRTVVRSLGDFHRLEVTKERSTAMNTEGAHRNKTVKFTRRFYLVGRERLLIAKRSYSSNDRETQSVVNRMESAIRDAMRQHGIW